MQMRHSQRLQWMLAPVRKRQHPKRHPGQRTRIGAIQRMAASAAVVAACGDADGDAAH
jgi:hypothetical protein